MKDTYKQITPEAESKEKHGVWDPMLESTLTLCQSRFYPPVRDFGFLWKFFVEDSVVGQHWFHVDPDAGILLNKILIFYSWKIYIFLNL